MKLRKQIKRFVYGRLPGFRGAFPYFGARVFFPKRSQGFYAACAQGVFEAENVRVLNSLVRPETYFFDVGANIGLMSLPVLHHHATCRVVSFEASANVLPYLSRTLAESPYHRRWTLVPKAVGRSQGRVKFCLSETENNLFDGMCSTGRVPQAREVEVDLTTIDAEWTTIGRPKVSVIKCDVEGAELEVLRGGIECLQTLKPAVLLEWTAKNLHAYSCSHDALLDFAREIDFELYALPNVVRVETTRELDLQMQLTESFLLWPQS